MASHKFEELVREIISRSQSAYWDRAKLEWRLDHIYRSEEPGECPCSHFPIIEHCVPINEINGNEVTVGNVCVKQFMGLPSEKLFEGMARISANTKKAANKALVEHAFRKRWITPWENNFCLDTARKRVLTDRQMQKREQINRRILNRMEWKEPVAQV